MHQLSLYTWAMEREVEPKRVAENRRLLRIVRETRHSRRFSRLFRRGSR
jgi:hypothetical protein